jgi:AraC-like DNA-binding protein
LPSPQHFQLADLDRAGEGPFARWRRMIGAVFDVAATVDEIDHFDAQFMGYATRGFVVSEAGTSHIRLVRGPETVAGGGFDHFAVRLVRSGGMGGRAGHRTIDAKAGDICFFDLFQSLSLEVSADSEPAGDITLWIPRSRILSAFSNESALHGLVLRAGSPAGAIVGACLRCLYESAPRMSARDMDSIADGVVGLTGKAVANLLRQTEGEAATAPLASFVTARRFIDRNLTASALNAEMIAKAFGLSRASVYRLFEPAGGIASYIRKARLERAYQEITAPALSNRRIGQTAYSLGFKNVSAFNRLFLKTYGASPSEARETSRDGAPPVLGAGTEQAPSLGYFLRRIS